MGKIIELSHDDVQNELAYALICETMEGAYWNSGRRRRMFSKAFTRSEQQRISNIKAKAHKWYLVTGVPEKVRISITERKRSGRIQISKTNNKKTAHNIIWWAAFLEIYATITNYRIRSEWTVLHI